MLSDMHKMVLTTNNYLHVHVYVYPLSSTEFKDYFKEISEHYMEMLRKNL